MNRDGRKPLSQRIRSEEEFGDEFQQDMLAVSNDIQNELKSKGLVWRWVDYMRMKQMDGYHPRGWVLYKRKADDKLDKDEVRIGRDPSGLIRRGSLVLAVRPKETNDRHKAYLKHRASQYTVKSKKKELDGLKQKAKQLNLDTKIVDGYEE